MRRFSKSSIKTTHINKHSQSTLIRLTALWALNEAALGGILHLFRVPFTGLIVGGCAVLLLSLIAYVSKSPGKDIPKALLVVLLIKVIVSPHAPVTAYIAVIFQGLFAIFVFKNFKNYRVGAMLFSIVALLETALQKLILLALLFGKSLWESIDAFVDFVLQRFNLLADDVTVQASIWLVALYLGIYLLGSIIIGWLSGKLPAEIDNASERLEMPDFSDGLQSEEIKTRSKRKWINNPAFKWAAGILIILTGVYYLVPGASESMQPLVLLFRVVILLFLWYLLVAPTLMKILQGFLKKRSSQYRSEVNLAMSLFPIFKKLIRLSWLETKDLKGIRRWKELLVRIITYSLVASKR